MDPFAGLPQWAAMALNLAVVGFLIPWLRRSGRSSKAVEMATRARDLLAWFLAQGISPAQAVRSVATQLQETFRVNQKVAERVAAGAAQAAGVSELTHKGGPR